jgi:hypothetical protein
MKQKQQINWHRPVEIPPDVLEIIEYTKLRKKYKTMDDKLRRRSRVPLEGSISMKQMRKLLDKLKRIEREAKE